MLYFSIIEAFPHCTKTEILECLSNRDKCCKILSLLNALDLLRLSIDMPIYVNSFYRDSEHNIKVGGSVSSQHMFGEAADIRCADFSILIKAIVKYKEYFGQCIVYPTFVHLALPNSKHTTFTLTYKK